MDLRRKIRVHINRGFTVIKMIKLINSLAKSVLMWYNKFGTLKIEWDEVALTSQFLYNFCDKITLA